MHLIFSLLALVVGLGSLVCSVIILIEAFKDEIWKGFVCILCGLYFLYYAFIDFDHEKKWLIVAGSLLGGTLASVFQVLAR
jgi:hypothetical protein